MILNRKISTHILMIYNKGYQNFDYPNPNAGGLNNIQIFKPNIRMTID